MNADQVTAVRALLGPTGWLDRTDYFATALRRSARTPHGLLVVGTPGYEPWHMTAHLADESRVAALPGLAPTLVRWAPPPGAPAHLAVSMSRLLATGRGETLLVVGAEPAPAELLERVQDVRRLGATVFALDRGDPELDGLAHESLPAPEHSVPVTFDAVQHLVSVASAAPARPAAGGSHARAGSRGLRARLARLLDTVAGTPAD